MFHNFIAIMQSPLGSSHKRHSINLICPCITLHFTAIIWHLEELRGTISFRSSDEGTCRRLEASKRVLGKGSPASFQNSTGEGVRFREIYFTLPWGFLLNVTRYVSSTVLQKNEPMQGFLYKTGYVWHGSLLLHCSGAEGHSTGESRVETVIHRLCFRSCYLPHHCQETSRLHFRSDHDARQTSPGIWKLRYKIYRVNLQGRQAMS